MHQVTAQSAAAISPNNAEYGSDMGGGSSGGSLGSEFWCRSRWSNGRPKCSDESSRRCYIGGIPIAHNGTRSRYF